MTASATQPISNTPQLGYSFNSNSPASSGGLHRLEIWLRALPTEHHYDPESVTCRVVSAQHSVETLIVRHPWADPNHYQIPFGLIALNDRRNKKIEALTFGGELQIESTSEATLCLFESAAPILALFEPDSLATHLIAEVEALMGQQRARWNSELVNSDFDEHLAAVDPFKLYLACLVSVTQRLRTIHQSDDRLHEILHFIEHEHQTLRSAGLWPPEPQSLDELLSQKSHR